MKKFAIIFLCFFLFTYEKQNQNPQVVEIKIENFKENKIPELNHTSEKENAKICIQKLDKNFFEENKNERNKATLQTFYTNNNCYYIFIEKTFLPFYLVFSFDDTSGTQNPRNGAYYFFDSINMQDFDGHDYSPIQGDFINSLDNLLIENNLEIPKISYNLEEDLQNKYFISNSIEKEDYENILEKIWEYRNSQNYSEQKKFYKNEDKKFLENIKLELKELKECWESCEKGYKKINEQYIKKNTLRLASEYFYEYYIKPQKIPFSGISIIL